MASRSCEVVVEDCMVGDRVIEVSGDDARNEEVVGSSARVIVADLKVAGREVCRRFGSLVQSQKERKRITVVVAAELEGIRGEFEEIYDRLWEENSKLKGKLEENRKHLKEVMEASATMSRGVQEVREKEAVKASQGKVGAEVLKEASKGRKGKGTGKDKEAPREVRKGASKEVRKEMGSEVRKDEVASEKPPGRKEEDDFTEVKRKKIVRKEAEERKRESWRAKEPPKSFIIPAGEGGVEAVKKKTWAEIAGKIGAPQITKMVVMPRGDIRVFPGNEKTSKALSEIEIEGKLGAKEARQRWPKVIVYDVERSISAEELPSAIGLQNPELGLAKGKEREAIKPIFQKGPKVSQEGNLERDKVTSWVCELSPALFNRLAGRYVYLGFGRCKVSEWKEVLQCRGCQGFGHMEAKCLRKRLICRYCAKEGHRKEECKEMEGPPKCFNCGKQSQAGHTGCEVRKWVARATMERTCYGIK